VDFVLQRRRVIWIQTQTLCLQCCGPGLRAAFWILLQRWLSMATLVPSPYPYCKELPAGCSGRRHSKADSRRHCLGFFVTLSSRLVRLRSILWRAAQFLFWFRSEERRVGKEGRLRW